MQDAKIGVYLDKVCGRALLEAEIKCCVTERAELKINHNHNCATFQVLKCQEKNLGKMLLDENLFMHLEDQPIMKAK